MLGHFGNPVIHPFLHPFIVHLHATLHAGTEGAGEKQAALLPVF